MISPSQRPLPDNTQHSQHTNIYAPGGILTHNLSRRAADNLRLRPRGHWDRRIQDVLAQNIRQLIVMYAYYLAVFMLRNSDSIVFFVLTKVVGFCLNLFYLKEKDKAIYF